MLSKKIWAYVGVLSIGYPTVTTAMKPQYGNFMLYGKNSVIMEGSPVTVPVVSDVSTVLYEDFDATSYLSKISFGGEVFSSTKKRIHAVHLDTNVPYIGVAHPYVDYEALESIPLFISRYLKDKVHPSVHTRAKDFFENVIIPNQQLLSCYTRKIPDLDCLYYRDVFGEQHLLLRLSSKTRRKAERFKQKSSGKSVFVEDGDATIFSGKDMALDHQNIEAKNIYCEAKNSLYNSASKMKAQEDIRIKAEKQRNETKINKWMRDEGNSKKGSHTEGIESIDDCSFKARRVIQSGRKVDNIGILVDAEVFEDLACHTENMPAKITLYNRAWEEKNGFFSSSRTEVNREDDVLVPTRYHVDFYRSRNSKPGSSVKFGYTLIDAGSRIEIEKDIKEDVVIDEKHVIEIHEEKSGFSFFGGVSIPDPTGLLRKLDYASSSNNMTCLSIETINAAAKGIQLYEDAKELQNVLNKGSWSINDTSRLLQVLSHFMNGPSIQFGTRSMDMRQSSTISHGNVFTAPEQVYNNKQRSVFAGDYFGQFIKIRTNTFVTLDLPDIMDYEMSVHQTGVNMDLLSFAILLMNPQISGALNAGLTASSVSVSCNSNRMHQETHRSTRIYANTFDVNAKYGHLTQAQIKAGIVHAVFTKNLALKTLKNEKWTVQSGNSFSVGLGGFASFEDLAKTIKNVALSATVSHVDSGEIDKVIDSFAALVGEEEFYLKVGGVLETKSALVGHVNHDSRHEYIDAKSYRNSEEKQEHKSWNKSWNLSAKAVVDVVDSLTPKKEQKRNPLADINLDELPPEEQKHQKRENQQKKKAEEKQKVHHYEQPAKTEEKPRERKMTKYEFLSQLIDQQEKEERALKRAKSRHRHDPERILNLQQLHEDQLVQKAMNDSPKTIIGEAEVACGVIGATIGEAVQEADNLNAKEYVDLEKSRLGITGDGTNYPEMLCGIAEEKVLLQGAKKLGNGISKVAEKIDDMTGNVVSAAVSWTAQKFENLCNTAEEAAGNFVQKVGGNETAVNYARDGVRVGIKATKEVAILAASSGVAKGVATVATKTTSTVGKVANKVGSQVKKVTNKNVVNQKIAEAATTNKAPYTPRKAQGLAENLLGSNEFTRSTVPGQSMPNVRLAGQCKERVIIDPITKEKITQRVVFDQRGFPQFDPYVKVETRITGDLSNMERAAHMRAATRQLRMDIESGKVSRRIFGELELEDIMRGKAKVGTYTWHHHQETGRMQLVPQDIHSWVKHMGGNEIWGMK